MRVEDAASASTNVAFCIWPVTKSIMLIPPGDGAGGTGALLTLVVCAKAVVDRTRRAAVHNLVDIFMVEFPVSDCEFGSDHVAKVRSLGVLTDPLQSDTARQNAPIQFFHPDLLGGETAHGTTRSRWLPDGTEKLIE